MSNKTDDGPDPDHYRRILLRLQDELTDIQKTGAEAADTVTLDQTRVGRLSRMDALQAQAISQETNRRRAATLGRIGAALKRLDGGDFGYCTACDEPIDPRRLSLDPTSVLCIGCASALEDG